MMKKYEEHGFIIETEKSKGIIKVTVSKGPIFRTWIFSQFTSQKNREIIIHKMKESIDKFYKINSK